MKKALTLITLFAMIFLSQLTSAATPSKLHLDLFNDGQFEVMVDGRRYLNVQNGLDVLRINPGTHRIKIVEVFRGRAYRNRGRSVLFNGTINIPFRSAVFARLTQNFQLRITEIQKLPIPRQPTPVVRRQPRRNAPTYRQRGRHYRPNYRNFDVVKLEISSATFEKDKLRLAKEYVNQGAITSSEVSSIMNHFTFEKTKVEFAKYAYAYTTDKHNYDWVRKSFTFDSSVRQLNRYISGR